MSDRTRTVIGFVLQASLAAACTYFGGNPGLLGFLCGTFAMLVIRLNDRDYRRGYLAALDHIHYARRVDPDVDRVLGDLKSEAERDWK